MPMHILAGILLTATLSVSVLQVHVLDLNGAFTKGTDASTSSGSGCAIGHSGTVAPTLPLSALLTLDRSNYFLGAHIVMDAEITNNGTDTIVLPWTVRPSHTASTDDREMSMLLVSSDPDRGDQVLAAVKLIGNTADPQSVILLNAGEHARIRFPTWLNVPEERVPSVVTAPGQTRPVRVKFLIGIGQCSWAQPVASEPLNISFRMPAGK